MPTDLDLSVVIPLYNEEENIDPCVEELLNVLDRLSERAEVILVDDGSSDLTTVRAFEWTHRDERVKVVQFRKNFGQTAAISAGFRHARGRTVILMDGDQQNDPADIPRMLELRAEGWDVVSGWRKDRKDKLIRRKLPSKVANSLISRATGTDLHDYGCTLKAYDADVASRLHLYGELHRFIPALAATAGASVIELPVNHRARTRGSSKYGISRTLRVLLDLITVKFLTSYMKRPMQFFGRLGLFSFGIGFSTLLWLAGSKIFTGASLANRPLLVLGGILTMLGVEVLCIGLIGEMIMRVYYEGRDRTQYVIRAWTGGGSPDGRSA
jgi:glycosyltransferase involved in cell wall biosynthesis